MRCDKLAKNQRAEIAMFQMLEVQEAPAFNGRRSFLTLRDRYVSVPRVRGVTEPTPIITAIMVMTEEIAMAYIATPGSGFPPSCVGVPTTNSWITTGTTMEIPSSIVAIRN